MPQNVASDQGLYSLHFLDASGDSYLMELFKFYDMFGKESRWPEYLG